MTVVSDAGGSNRRLRAEPVAYPDAVEVECHSTARLITRWRFLRDTPARLYAARLRRELKQHGYTDFGHQLFNSDW